VAETASQLEQHISAEREKLGNDMALIHRKLKTEARNLAITAAIVGVILGGAALIRKFANRRGRSRWILKGW